MISQAPELAQMKNDVAALALSIDQLDAKSAMAAISCKSNNWVSWRVSVVLNLNSRKHAGLLRAVSTIQRRPRACITKPCSCWMRRLFWRERALTDLAPALVSYDMAIKESIGLRLQERMSDDLATTVSACMATHKDISLQF